MVTWDPRGEFASGGILHLDSEDFEARDVSAIIDWVATQHTRSSTTRTSTNDPRIGMVGGSYGGGIQLTSAGIESRIDAIAPGIAWNSLDTALYPNDAFKTSWASLLLLSLVVSGSRIDSEIYAGIATGVLTGFLTEGQQDFLSENSPETVIENIEIPTLFLQGTVDGLFTLQQALNNAEGLTARRAGQDDLVLRRSRRLPGSRRRAASPADQVPGGRAAGVDGQLREAHARSRRRPLTTEVQLDRPARRLVLVERAADRSHQLLRPFDPGLGQRRPPADPAGPRRLGPPAAVDVPCLITLAAPAAIALNVPIPTPATRRTSLAPRS